MHGRGDVVELFHVSMGENSVYLSDEETFAVVAVRARLGVMSIIQKYMCNGMV